MSFRHTHWWSSSTAKTRAQWNSRTMANWRQVVYTTGVVIPAMTWASGCGEKPKQPPPGAPAEQPIPPEVELGSDSSSAAPKDSEGASQGSSSDVGTSDEAR